MHRTIQWSRSRRKLVATVIGAVCVLLPGGGCGGGGGSDSAPGSTEDPVVEPGENRSFRALAGVSMGAYGAMNLGTKYPDLFGVVAALGGPIDVNELLRHIIEDNLEVKAQAELPDGLGHDFTFDHWAPYPDRDTRIKMMQDLIIAFGNPFLHHPAPTRQYLASDSEPASVRRDDRFGEFSIPADPRGFLDGGDNNQDGLRQTTEPPTAPVDVVLLARGSLDMLTDAPQEMVGGRLLADLTANGVYDVGEGIVLNLSEPFEDTNMDLVYQPELGETFSDLGLDGVAETGDFGEENGTHDDDPDRANWIAQDPLTRLRDRPRESILEQRFYLDVGTQDEFLFVRHYDNMLAMFDEKGITFDRVDGLDGFSCFDVPDVDSDYLHFRYDGGHIGIPAVDEIRDVLRDGDFCSSLLVWQRIRNLLGYIDGRFTDGVYGVQGARVRGEVDLEQIESPALTRTEPVSRDVLVYRPPAFFNSELTFPVLYFLGGYGQEPADFERIGDLLDVLIVAGEMQNVFFVALPGSGNRQGSFYVNRAVETEGTAADDGTSGRYEDSIIDDLVPLVESDLLEGRVRRTSR